MSHRTGFRVSWSVVPLLALVITMLVACAPSTAAPPKAEPTKSGEVLGATPIAPPKSAAPAAEAPKAAVPAQETELVVYTPVLYGPIVERTASRIMKERFNVRVVWQDLLTSEMYTKVLSQRDRPEASIAMPNVDLYLAGVNAGLWEELDLSKLSNAQFLHDYAKSDPFGRHGFAISASMPVLQYHTKVFEQNGWSPPTSWKDLADPKYKGRVGLTSTASGTAVSWLSFLSRLEGAPRGNIDPGINFARQLVDAGQVHSFPTRSSEVNQLMERGEIWIATQWGEGALQFAAQGGPVAAVYPVEGTFLSPTEISVVKNAPNREMAMEFVNVVLGEEPQREFVVDRWAVPARKGLNLPANYADFLPVTEEQLKKMPLPDFAELAEFRAQWHDRWVREVEKK